MNDRARIVIVKGFRRMLPGIVTGKRALLFEFAALRPVTFKRGPANISQKLRFRAKGGGQLWRAVAFCTVQIAHGISY